eukprot:395064-Rhodomonas_salina.2
MWKTQRSSQVGVHACAWGCASVCRRRRAMRQGARGTVRQRGEQEALSGMCRRLCLTCEAVSCKVLRQCGEQAERFGDFTTRVGIDAINAYIEKYETGTAFKNVVREELAPLTRTVTKSGSVHWLCGDARGGCDMGLLRDLIRGCRRESETGGTGRIKRGRIKRADC